MNVRGWERCRERVAGNQQGTGKLGLGANHLTPLGLSFHIHKVGIITLGLSSSQAEQRFVLRFFLSTQCDTQHTVGGKEGKAPSVRPGTQEIITTLNNLEQPPISQIKSPSTLPPNQFF